MTNELTPGPVFRVGDRVRFKRADEHKDADKRAFVVEEVVGSSGLRIVPAPNQGGTDLAPWRLVNRESMRFSLETGFVQVLIARGGNGDAAQLCWWVLGEEEQGVWIVDDHNVQTLIGILAHEEQKYGIHFHVAISALESVTGRLGIGADFRSTIRARTDREEKWKWPLPAHPTRVPLLPATPTVDGVRKIGVAIRLGAFELVEDYAGVTLHTNLRGGRDAIMFVPELVRGDVDDLIAVLTRYRDGVRS